MLFSKSNVIQTFSDLIAVPDFLAGAMENWGLMTFRENLLLFDPKSGNAFDKQLVAIVIAHEMAHQVVSYSVYQISLLSNVMFVNPLQ